MKRAIMFAVVMLLGLASVRADDWNPITPPGAPDARQGHSMVTLPDGRVFLFGGEDAQGSLFNDLYAFENNGWAEVTSNNSPPPVRRDHQAWARDDVMYVYGGYGENGALEDMWSYDSVANTWQQEGISGTRPVPRHGHASTTLTDGSEIIVGGTNAKGAPLKDCWKLNLNNTFTQLQDAPYAYTGHSMELGPNGEWLYVFGTPGSLGIYRVSTDRWSLVSGGPPNGPGCCTSRGVNAAGEPVVFIFGGKDINGNEMSDVYEYNLYGGELTQRGDMPQPIVNGADAQLPVVAPGKQQFGGNNWLMFGGLSGGIPTNNSYAFTPTPDQLDGKIGVYRSNSGLWAIKGLTRAYFGTENDTPIYEDFDGDSTKDIGIFRPANGLWAIRGLTRVYFGGENDTPITGNFNGNPSSAIAIFRPDSGLWAIKDLTRIYFGGSEDQPIPADFNGDGTTDVGVYRSASGLWAIKGLTRAYFGGVADNPVPCNYGGGGRSDIAVFRPASGLWAVRSLTRCYYGSSSDEPIPYDYDGDTTADVGVFRDSSGLWALRGISRVYFGGAGDIPITRPAWRD